MIAALADSSTACTSSAKALVGTGPLLFPCCMRSPYFAQDSRSAYFVTATIVEWLPVFNSTECCNILIRALLDAREHRSLQVHAWVILEGHFHAILSSPDLGRALRDLKRSTGRKFMEQIQRERRDWLAHRLAAHGAARPGAEGAVWQEGGQTVEIKSEGEMRQKREDLELTPVRRGYVAAPEHWRYSSAHQAPPGVDPLFEVDSWKGVVA